MFVVFNVLNNYKGCNTHLWKSTCSNVAYLTQFDYITFLQNVPLDISLSIQSLKHTFKQQTQFHKHHTLIWLWNMKKP